MAKKAAIALDAGELQQIKSFYEQERIQLAARLQHVDQVIARLGGASRRFREVQYRLLLRHQHPLHRRSADQAVPRKTDAPVEVKATKKAGRPKKRGPKSVWGNFILRRLRQCDRPLSYSELVRDAMVLNNLPAEKEKNAKASVLNAAFRLRSTLGKIDTVGLPGKKEKFLVLKSWMNADGGLKAPYDKLFAAVANKPMDDRGRQPRRPSAASSTESKVKARMKSADAKPAVKKTRKAPSRPPRKPLPRARSRPPRRPLPRAEAGRQERPLPPRKPRSRQEDDGARKLDGHFPLTTRKRAPRKAPFFHANRSAYAWWNG